MVTFFIHPARELGRQHETLSPESRRRINDAAG